MNGETCTVVVMKKINVKRELYFTQRKVTLLKMLQATVSHDMISPLNLIIMYLSLLENMPQLKEKPKEPTKKKKKQKKGYIGGQHDVQSLIQQMRNASKFAQMKFKDLLDVSLLDNGSFTLQESRFNVHEIIKEVCDLMEVQASAQKLTIDLNLAQLSIIDAIGDSNRIQQVLLNILSNAIKFSP
mmetsp:Transcript_21711/g.29116  ORF Transcript_21711/g.29116 Transcript_21711/m.29116 type:complete len:185 (-) Transcript_21711:897-1451(-)